MPHIRTFTCGMRHETKDKAATEIRRVWGDLDVVDAKSDLRVFILPEDVAKATPKDPAACVFAQACRRTFGAKKVLFFRTVAYVELPDDHGKRRVERFIMNSSMRDLIDRWDRGKDIIPDGGFLLRAPSRANTFDAERVRKQQEKARAHQRSLDGYRMETKKPEPASPIAKAEPASTLSDNKKIAKPGTVEKHKAAISPKPEALPVPVAVTKGKGRYRDEPLLIDTNADPVRNGGGSVHFTRAGLRVARTAGIPIDVRPEQGGSAS
jgi:hypothetical protein